MLAALNAGIAEFQRNPYRFLCEFDVQAAMFHHLRKMVDGTVAVKRCRNGSEPYTLDLVYSEYKSNIDLVCLDPEAITTYMTTVDEKDLHRWQGWDVYVGELPLLLAIELKYVKIYGGYGCFRDCVSDMAKLRAFPDVKHRLVLAYAPSQESTNDFLRNPDAPKTQNERSALSSLDGIYLVTPDTILDLQP